MPCLPCAALRNSPGRNKNTFNIERCGTEMTLAAATVFPSPDGAGGGSYVLLLTACQDLEAYLCCPYG